MAIWIGRPLAGAIGDRTAHRFPLPWLVIVFRRYRLIRRVFWLL